MPRGDYVYSSLTRTIFAKLPFVARMYRQVMLFQSLFSTALAVLFTLVDSGIDVVLGT